MAVSSPHSTSQSLPAARPHVVALVVALAYFMAALSVLGDYGPTWDHVQGEYPYGERLLGYLETGDARFLDLRHREPEPHVREPHLDLDQRRFPTYFVYPVGALSSALACRVLWTGLGLVPAMTAHNLPAALFAAVLVYVVTLFTARRFGWLAALVAGGSLAAAPVFFGHAASNIKDVPECCLYTCAVLAGLHAFERGRARSWLVAGLLVGLALAQKPNALFLPVQLALFVALARMLVPRAEAPRLGLLGLAAAALGFLGAYYGASPAFWHEPIAGPVRWIEWMLMSGSWGFREGFEAKARLVSVHAPVAVLYTTPLVTLALALVGLCAPMPRTLRIFLVLGVVLPIGRNLLPGMRNFGGVRHFLEFFPLLCILAGAGATALVRRVHTWPGGRAWLAPAVSAALVLVALVPPARATIALHPNQTTYFNPLVGGLGGAQERRMGDATDAWCNTYWQGMRWLAEHAEPNATLLVPRGDFVARAAAPVVLRPDIRVWSDKDPLREPWPLYVMDLGPRPVMAATRALDAGSVPAFQIRADGGVLLRLYRVAAPPQGNWYAEHWQVQAAVRADRKRVMAYMRQHPEIVADVTRLFVLDRETALERLRPFFPPELHAALESALHSTLPSSSEEEFR